MKNRVLWSIGAVAFGKSLALAVTLALVPVVFASAADTNSVNSETIRPFGTVWRINGGVFASTASGGQERQLREGDKVFAGERVQASATGEAVLNTEDAGIVAIRPHATFVVESYAAEGKSTDNVTLKLLTGSLRVITGWIGKLNGAGHRISMPTATIGVRGTDHEPYVMSADRAPSSGHPEGAYDKVNRGGTTMEVGTFKLDIDPGKVGFSRAEPKATDRALLTLLLPLLLDKIPSFYVGGQFDAELDQLSLTADENSLNLLKQKQLISGASPTVVCTLDATTLAQEWLAKLDNAIGQADANASLALFAPDVSIRATVQSANGAVTTLDLQRDELVRSTISSLKELKDYTQRRMALEAKMLDAGQSCKSVNLKSVVIEQGLQGGRPFRFESLEEYILQNRDGQWVAIKATTTQR